MKSKVNMFLFLTMSAFLLSASCDKNIDDIDTNDLPEPIKINLRSSEVEMVESDIDFAFELFRNVFEEEASDNDNNFMISPFSLSMSLAMIRNGAGGETKAAIQRVLKLSEHSDEEINGYYHKLRESLLKTDPSTKLSIANSIWTNKNVKINNEFITVNTKFFNSAVESLDFSNNNAVDRINKWAADNTNDLIDHVLLKTDPMDLMYLLNAIYFKGKWSSQFDVKNTSRKPFYSENGSYKNVDMMHQSSDFNYTENNTFQMLQLLYGNKAFSMIILLPKENKELSDINKELVDNAAWMDLKSGLRKTKVDLYLPKFKTEFNMRFNNILIDMGMGVAFDSGVADFSRMSATDAFISFVDQFTYITTDEVGTEAAAVTVIGVKLTSYQPSKTVFNANKPFIYLIQENSTGSILFMGSVKNID